MFVIYTVFVLIRIHAPIGTESVLILIIIIQCKKFLFCQKNKGCVYSFNSLDNFEHLGNFEHESSPESQIICTIVHLFYWFCEASEIQN